MTKLITVFVCYLVAALSVGSFTALAASEAVAANEQGCDALSQKGVSLLPLKPAAILRPMFSPGSMSGPVVANFDAELLGGRTLAKAEVDRILQKLSQLYRPYFEDFHKSLTIKNLWSSTEIEAKASLDELSHPVIEVHGGLARHRWMTSDALSMFVCHELGHFLGGAPKKPRGNSAKVSWSSAEGQADYFAANKCARLMFDNDIENQSVVDGLDAQEKQDLSSGCNGFQCMRISYAGKIMAKVIADAKGWSSNLNVATPDRSVVNRTLFAHPRLQCRLDTVVNGVNCQSDPEELFDDQDPIVGACIRGVTNTDLLGPRPRCWYAATK